MMRLPRSMEGSAARVMSTSPRQFRSIMESTASSEMVCQSPNLPKPAAFTR